MSVPRDLGLRALQAGDVNGAIAHLTEARDSNPADCATLAYLGAALGRAGRTSEAVEALQAAVQLQPAQAASHYNLGVAFEKAGRAAEAHASYQQAMTLDPNYLRARDGLARTAASAAQPQAPADPRAPGFWDSARSMMSGPGGVPPAGPGLASGQVPPPLSQPGAYGPPPAPPPFGTPAGSSSGAGAFAPTGNAPAVGSAAVPGAYGAPARGLPKGIPGARYQAPPRAAPVAADPGTRITRGLLWGLLYGQYWMLWQTLSLLIWGFSGRFGTSPVAVIVIAVAILTVAGGLTGLLIGALNVESGVAAGIGIGVGLVLFGLKVWLLGLGYLFGVFFWVVTGRFVGAGDSGPESIGGRDSAGAAATPKAAGSGGRNYARAPTRSA